MPKAPLKLPARDGVNASTLVLPGGTWPGLLDFLCQHFDNVSRAQWQQRLQSGLVCDANGQALNAESPYRAHQTIQYYRAVPDEARIPFSHRILHQNERLIVVDKPHFLPVIPAGNYLQETLLVRLKRETGIESLSPIHRLDRETAGVMLFCIQAQHRHAYQSLFQRREVSKTYLALAPYLAGMSLPQTRQSRLQESSQFMRMQEVPGPVNAITQIQLIEHDGQRGLYQLQPRTGKKHQLRVHMNALGMPIVNDTLYPERSRAEAVANYDAPLQLLAKAIAFTDPISGEPHCFESRLALQWPNRP
jgi:tRNA pseudouridine32 synthase / 23S rRNA pseudouridine746 synthase